MDVSALYVIRMHGKISKVLDLQPITDLLVCMTKITEKLKFLNSAKSNFISCNHDLKCEAPAVHIPCMKILCYKILKSKSNFFSRQNL